MGSALEYENATPPYEGVYLGGDEIKTLQEVTHCYRESGVGSADDAGNLPDFIGLELDFLCYLCEQQAEAWEKGDEIEAQKFQLSEHSFLERII